LHGGEWRDWRASLGLDLLGFLLFLVAAQLTFGHDNSPLTSWEAAPDGAAGAAIVNRATTALQKAGDGTAAPAIGAAANRGGPLVAIVRPNMKDWIRHRWRALPANEVEQAVVRLAYMPLGYVYCKVTHLWDIEALHWIAWVVIPLAFVMLAHLFFRPHSTQRRDWGVVLDQAAVLATVATTNPTVAPLMFMSAMISVGYGLRFGSRYAVFSAALASAGFTAIAVFVPAFQAEPYWMAAIIGCVGLTPLYSAFLARRLEQRQVATEARSRQLAYEASHDALTGLANRKSFVTALEAALEETEGRRRALAVLYVDLDGFKAINDRLGHAAGDTILCLVADCLRNSVRAGDLVARQGGDEFLILVRDLLREEEGLDVAAGLDERLRRALTVDEQVSAAVASVGVATYTGTTPRPSVEALIAEADAAMYAAKAEHRRIPST
jgi:diguanylate cyclase